MVITLILAQLIWLTYLIEPKLLKSSKNLNHEIQINMKRIKKINKKIMFQAIIYYVIMIHMKKKYGNQNNGNNQY